MIETVDAKVALIQALRTLIARGLRLDPGLLWIIDGGKGLRAAIRAVAGPRPSSSAASGTNGRMLLVISRGASR